MSHDQLNSRMPRVASNDYKEQKKKERQPRDESRSNVRELNTRVVRADRSYRDAVQ